MSLSTYESSVKTISCNKEMVFAVLSDLSNLEKIKEKLPKDKVKEISFDTDSISFKVDAIGTLGFRIIEREPHKTIKFESENSPILVNLWIQLVDTSDTECKMKLTLKADFPAMIKMMVGGKINDGLEKMADVLSQVPYAKMQGEKLI